jgi:amino acid exporter
MLAYLLIGLALGAGSSVIPGPCGLAVISAARYHGGRRAVATAFGAALGDAVYASLGVGGVGQVLAECSAALPILDAISGVMLIAYGVHTLRRRPPAVATSEPSRSGRAWIGLPVGLCLSLSNPAVLVTWVVLLGSALHGASVGSQVAAIAGITAGTAAWFSSVAVITHRGARSSGRAIARITRVVCGLMIAYGGVLLARASCSG